MSEPINETICDQLEGPLWDRVNGLVTDEPLLYAWDRAMIPNVHRVFNRVFNSVEEEEAPPVVEDGDADV